MRRAPKILLEWVRRANRVVRRRAPVTDPRKKIDAIRAAAHNSFPTADIDKMLAELESGYPGTGRS